MNNKYIILNNIYLIFINKNKSSLFNFYLILSACYYVHL